MQKPFRFVYVFLLVSIGVAQAQKTPLTVESIYGRSTFAYRTVDDVNWMRNGRFYTALTQANGQAAVVKYNVATGQPVETLFEAARLGGGAGAVNSYELSPSEDKLLVATATEGIYRWSTKSEYYVYDLATRRAVRLSAGGKQSNAAFSPDGRRIAFTRDNNLFVSDLQTGTETALTTTGRPGTLIHGSTDWVYEEEFGFTRAFGWNADGTRLAYYTFNESAVPEYTMQLWGGLYPVNNRFKYPKAGEKNAVVTLTIHDLARNTTVPVDLGPEADQYIPRMNWTQNPAVLSVRRLNRLQNRLDILHADAATGRTTAVVTESSPAYIDLERTDDLTYLADGRQFVHASERTGFKHLYLHDMAGRLVRPLTAGNWEVDEFLGVDEKKGLLYFTSTEGSPLERHLYRIGLDGRRKQRLSTAPGVHHPDFSPDMTYYLDKFSDASAPPSVGLYTAPDGKPVKMLETNADLKGRLQEYQLSRQEFFQFSIPDGTRLNGWMIKPAAFDPAKKYPVLMFVYGGPGNQQVLDEWTHQGLWFQLLAQRGYLVACVDNRGTGGRGAAFRQATYANLGRLEVQDQIQAATYLGTLPYVDKARIGIHGWSYGGYMAALCITVGADHFKLAISGAPVTTWRFYDTIYTERYLKRPQDNPAGYDDNSPLTHAGKLKGKFLLIHGTGDDNVHFQNSIALQQELINQGKAFDTFIYPNQAHGIRGRSRLHLYNLMTRYITENL